MLQTWSERCGDRGFVVICQRKGGIGYLHFPHPEPRLLVSRDPQETLLVYAGKITVQAILPHVVSQLTACPGSD